MPRPADNQRLGGQQQSGQPRGDVDLAVGDEQERADDVDEREHADDRQPPAKLPQHAGADGDRQQDQRGDSGAPDDDDGRRQLGDGELDEQVGDAPQDGQRGQQHPGSSTHASRVPG
jgi:hypothetical protein